MEENENSLTLVADQLTWTVESYKYSGRVAERFVIASVSRYASQAEDHDGNAWHGYVTSDLLDDWFPTAEQAKMAVEALLLGGAA
jgi:hypothetical protein